MCWEENGFAGVKIIDSPKQKTYFSEQNFCRGDLFRRSEAISFYNKMFYSNRSKDQGDLEQQVFGLHHERKLQQGVQLNCSHLQIAFKDCQEFYISFSALVRLWFVVTLHLTAGVGFFSFLFFFFLLDSQNIFLAGYE